MAIVPWACGLEAGPVKLELLLSPFCDKGGDRFRCDSHEEWRFFGKKLLETIQKWFLTTDRTITTKQSGVLVGSFFPKALQQQNATVETVGSARPTLGEPFDPTSLDPKRRYNPTRLFRCKICRSNCGFAGSSFDTGAFSDSGSTVPSQVTLLTSVQQRSDPVAVGQVTRFILSKERLKDDRARSLCFLRSWFWARFRSASQSRFPHQK